MVGVKTEMRFDDVGGLDAEMDEVLESLTMPLRVAAVSRP